MLARGAVYADLDGDLDVAVAGFDGPAHVFRNDGGNRNNWFRVRTAGSRSNRSGIGAVVRETSASGTQWQVVHSGSSYASQSELTLTFGLAGDSRISALEVEWPSGARQRFADIEPNRLVVVNEEKGLEFTGRQGKPSVPDGAAPRR